MARDKHQLVEEFERAVDLKTNQLKKDGAYVSPIEYKEAGPARTSGIFTEEIPCGEGVRASDVTMSIKGRILTVEVRKNEKSGAFQEFGKMFTIPKNVDVDQLTSVLSDGVLKIEAPFIDPTETEQLQNSYNQQQEQQQRLQQQLQQQQQKIREQQEQQKIREQQEQQRKLKEQQEQQWRQQQEEQQRRQQEQQRKIKEQQEQRQREQQEQQRKIKEQQEQRQREQQEQQRRVREQQEQQRFREQQIKQQQQQQEQRWTKTINITTTAPPPSPATVRSPGRGYDSPNRNTNQNQSSLSLAVDLHNDVRRKHGASDLTLSAKLCDQAQGYSDALANGRKPVVPSGVGRNVFTLETTGTPMGSVEAVQEAVKSWYDHQKLYNWNQPLTSPEYANLFSQVVWKSTEELGIGVSTKGGVTVVTCLYFPAGNVQSDERYRDNVQRSGRY